MEKLDLLWELEKHSNTLNHIKREFKQRVNEKEIEALGKKLKETEKELMDLEERIDVKEQKLNRDNSTLKDYDYHLQEIEKDLYGGNITDIQQLNFLDEERQILRKNIGDKEVEILEQLDEMEELREEFIMIEESFEKFKKEYNHMVRDYKLLVDDYRRKIMESKEKVDYISLKVDKDLLERYRKIKNNMNNAIVEVLDYKCGGCNMMISTFMIDRLKADREIVYCESCGRILYLRSSTLH